MKLYVLQTIKLDATCYWNLEVHPIRVPEPGPEYRVWWMKICLADSAQAS